MQIVNAQTEDAKDLAILVNLAGEGMPKLMWATMAEQGETPLDVGTKRAMRKTGDFSYTNARLCQDNNNKTMAALIAYPLANPYDTTDLQSQPDYIRPLIELESKVPGSWYINVLATYEPHRGKGCATALIKDTEKTAIAANIKTASIIVNSENQTAKQLYEKLGYRQQNALPLIPFKGSNITGEWLLLAKDLVS